MKAKRGNTIILQKEKISALEQELKELTQLISQDKNWLIKELTIKKYNLIKEINRLRLTQIKPEIRVKPTYDDFSSDFEDFSNL